MSVNESIDDLITDFAILVTRHAAGTHINGIYVTGAASTFRIDAVVQPAFNLNRVIGGADLQARVDGQSSTEVYQLWTRTSLFERSPTTDPDVLTFRGADWTVARSEHWDESGEVHCHAVISKVTRGAS